MKKSNKSNVKSVSSLGSAFAEISAVETRLNALRAEANTKLTVALRGLPMEYGFTDTETFIKAVRNAGKTNAKSTRKVSRKSSKSNPRKARVSITPEKREAVVTDLKAGMASLDAANKHSISLATVQNIKKAAGLVKARS